MRYRHLLEHEPRKAVGMLGVVVPKDILSAGVEPPSTEPASAARLTRTGSGPPVRAVGAETVVLTAPEPANDNAKKDVDDQEDLEARHGG